MATVQGPGLSIDASGKLADVIVFSKWKGINYIRQWVIPFNPKTIAQVAIRDKFTSYVALWQTGLDDPARLAWTARAKELGLQMSGFNFFIQQCFKQNIVPPALPVLP